MYMKKEIIVSLIFALVLSGCSFDFLFKTKVDNPKKIEEKVPLPPESAEEIVEPPETLSLNITIRNNAVPNDAKLAIFKDNIEVYQKVLEGGTLHGDKGQIDNIILEVLDDPFNLEVMEILYGSKQTLKVDPNFGSFIYIDYYQDSTSGSKIRIQHSKRPLEE